MKALCSLAAVFLVVAVWCAHPGVAYAEPGDIVARLGPGSNPAWSTDNRVVAFKRNGSLYVARTDSEKREPTLVAEEVGGYAWAPNSILVFGKTDATKRTTTSFYQSRIRTPEGAEKALVIESPALITDLDRAEGEPGKITGPWRLSDGSVGYFKLANSTIGPRQFVPLDGLESKSAGWRKLKTVIAKQEGSPYAQLWGDLWLIPLTTLEPTGHKLTTGELFGMVQMSPTGDRFAARSAKRDSWVLMDTLGMEIVPTWNEIEVLDNDVMAGAVRVAWSPDGTKLAYIRSVDPAPFSWTVS